MELQFFYGNPVKKDIASQKKLNNNKEEGENMEIEANPARGRRGRARRAATRARRATATRTRRAAATRTRRAAATRTRRAAAATRARRAAVASRVRRAAAATRTRRAAAATRARRAATAVRSRRRYRTQNLTLPTYQQAMRRGITYTPISGQHTVIRVKAPFKRFIEYNAKKGNSSKKVIVPREKLLKKLKAMAESDGSELIVARYNKGSAASVVSRKKRAKKAHDILTKAKLSGLKELQKLKRKNYKIYQKLLNPNPIEGESEMDAIEKITGHTLVEAGALLAGGAVHGFAQQSFRRYLPSVAKTLESVPVVGQSLPTLAIGALIVALGRKMDNDAVKMLGKGIVGASVVHLGSNIGRMVLPAASGTQVAQASRPATTVKGIPEGLGDADFGDADFGDADFGDADFGDAGQMGELEYNLSGVDFTPVDGVDFTPVDGVDFTPVDGVPEGLGHAGQMG